MALLNKTIASTCFIILGLIMTSAAGHADALKLDRTELKPFTNHYQMLFNGEALGEARMQLLIRDDNIYLLDHTDVPNFMIYETTVAVMNNKTLAPIKAFASGLMGGKVAAAEYDFEGLLVKGYSDFPRGPNESQGRIELETTLPTNTIDRSAAFILAPALPLQFEEPYKFNWYNGFGDTLKEISLQLVGEETVEVPLGTYETYKLEMLGGEPSQILYITKESPHVLVKIEIIDVPWVYELVSRE